VAPTEQSFFRRFVTESRTVIPLFRYLVLQTETHAFCLALAGAALIGFYPFCFFLLSLMKNILHWNRGADVVIAAITEYYPHSQDTFVNSLVARVGRAGKRLHLVSIVWILLGAAGVFIPLESALNRLWKVDEDRPYWLNQIVGLSLTSICGVLGIAFVTITASVQAITHLIFPFDYLAKKWDIFFVIEKVLDSITLRLSGICFLSIAILLFYKFLPNRRIEWNRVLPTALLAGIIAEIVQEVYINLLLPHMNMDLSQGPFYGSVSFVILAYFESFVVLGCAFLSTRTKRLPWPIFVRKKTDSSGEGGFRPPSLA
jgi:membrane protein